jgi:hypothetical protein
VFTLDEHISYGKGGGDDEKTSCASTPFEQERQMLTWADSTAQRQMMTERS